MLVPPSKPRSNEKASLKLSKPGHTLVLRSLESRNASKGRAFGIANTKSARSLTVNTTNASIHLESQHGIIIKEAESVVERNTKERLKSLFEKQGLQAEGMRKKSQESVLRKVINKDVVHEVLAQLIKLTSLIALCTDTVPIS
jgi:hypothetical protein